MAIDTETLGLNPNRDRLCLAQFVGGWRCLPCGAVLRRWRIHGAQPEKLLADPKCDQAVSLCPLRHRHVLAAISASTCKPVYCTKIALQAGAHLYRPARLWAIWCCDLLGIELSKEQQSSDWGAADLTEKQLAYAASDVAYLHQLKTILGHHAGARKPHPSGQGLLRFPCRSRAELDLNGWEETDIFAH